MYCLLFLASMDPCARTSRWQRRYAMSERIDRRREHEGVPRAPTVPLVVMVEQAQLEAVKQWQSTNVFALTSVLQLEPVVACNASAEGFEVCSEYAELLKILTL